MPSQRVAVIQPSASSAETRWQRAISRNSPRNARSGSGASQRSESGMDAGASSAFSDFSTVRSLILSTHILSTHIRSSEILYPQSRGFYAPTVHFYVEWGTIGVHAGGSAAEQTRKRHKAKI